MTTDELIDAVVSLPIEERAKVVEALLQTFNRPDETHAAAWLALAQQRLAELRAGQVTAVPGEELAAIRTAHADVDFAKAELDHKDFFVGREFWTEAGHWCCTDVGARTICAIRIDELSVDWRNGPPFACVETVFDENDFGALYASPITVPR